ncbi:probable G-protein coupled receptor No18 isoform X1 [Diorhabda sublineata]|nr:probable G-protein coupled receptor No18 isoform X1 [Diorhabda sublineata]
MSDIVPPDPPNYDYPIYPSNTLSIVPSETRQFFYWLILTLSVLSIIGNILAIRSIIERKTKYLQKFCIFTLSLTDMFSTVMYAINVLNMLSNELIAWNLGEFLCFFIPSAQTFGTTASSFMLLVIALDRNRNCVQTFSKCRWNPRPISCILYITFLLAVSAAISYPMQTYFNYEPIWILMVPYSADKANYQLDYLCFATKNKLKQYYITIDIVIFAPIILTFTCFYIQIATLVWKHRKPVTTKIGGYETKQSEDSTSSSTKTTNTNSSDNSKRTIIKLKHQKNIQVQRKIRTFRIVLVLMMSFICCRFPYWCYYTIRLVSLRNDDTSWNLHFALLALNMLNYVLNPLLYTFLNQTVAAIKMFKEFLWKICCYCFSNDEFQEFEQNSPFTIDQVKPACGTVQTRTNLGRFEDKNEKIEKF